MTMSQYMDKQIMDLANSQSNKINSGDDDFVDLISGGSGGVGARKEDVVPSYDFHPIRPIVATSSSPRSNYDSGNIGGGSRAWTTADTRTTKDAAVRNYSSLDSLETSKVVSEKDHKTVNAALIAEIDHTMKKYADNLLHALDGVSARLSQLETRTRQMENSLDDLRVSVGNNQGSTDGKLRQMENILREVQTSVEFVRDKQEILDAQLQLAKIQISKVDPQADTHNILHVDPPQPAASAPQPSQQQYPPSAHLQHPSTVPPPLPQQNLPSAPQPSQQQLPPGALMQLPATAPPPNAPPPPPQQNLPSQVQFSNQFPQNQIPSVPQQEAYFLPPNQTPENPSQQYQVPPPQQLQQSPPPPPHQQYQPLPQPQYSQPPPPGPAQPHPTAAPINPSHPQVPLGQHPEEASYAPSQNFPPSFRQPPPPGGSAPASQQFYGAPPNIYEPPSSRPGPGFSGAYGPSQHNEPYSYSSSPSHYAPGSPMKSQKPQSPRMGQSYPQLPTARILPQAIPTATAVGSGPGSTGGGNRAPIDDVIDKVTNMGFSRDQVRATVRKLTENGQSVDLNVVLDKLMNDTEGGQPPRGWFGGR